MRHICQMKFQKYTVIYQNTELNSDKKFLTDIKKATGNFKTWAGWDLNPHAFYCAGS